EHALAHRQPGRAVAESADHAGQLVSEDRWRSILAGAVLPRGRPPHFGRHESRSVNPHDDVIDRCRGLGSLHKGHPGRARGLIHYHYCLHRAPPVFSRLYRSRPRIPPSYHSLEKTGRTVCPTTGRRGRTGEGLQVRHRELTTLIVRVRMPCRASAARERERAYSSDDAHPPTENQRWRAPWQAQWQETRTAWSR